MKTTYGQLHWKGAYAMSLFVNGNGQACIRLHLFFRLKRKEMCGLYLHKYYTWKFCLREIQTHDCICTAFVLSYNSEQTLHLLKEHTWFTEYYFILSYRCNRETEVGVYSESRCRSTAHYFISPWSPQKQHLGVSHCGCRRRIWKSDVCLLGNWLWGNKF